MLIGKDYISLTIYNNVVKPDNLLYEKRHTNKLLKNKTKPVVIGLVYSESCIHCIHLKPVWKEMKTKIDKKVKSGKYKKPEYLEIEHNNIHKLEEFNQKRTTEMGGQKIVPEGYPTCFKVELGTVEYYKGNRESGEMEQWFMKNSAIIAPKSKKMKFKKTRRTIKRRK